MTGKRSAHERFPEVIADAVRVFARHRHSDPYGAAIPPGLAQETAVDALLHALVPPHHLPALMPPHHLPVPYQGNHVNGEHQ